MASLLSLGGAAWVVYDRVRSTTSMASDIKHWLAFLIPHTSDVQLSTLLNLITQRVEVIVPVLNFLIVYQAQCSSFSQNAVFNARDILFRMEAFVESCAKIQLEKQKANTSLPAPSSEQTTRQEMLTGFKHHLKELEFAMSSLSLCATMLNATRLGQLAVGKPASEYHVSPSALLTATSRLSDMKGISGDVICSYGALYTAANASVLVTSIHDTNDEKVTPEAFKSPVFINEYMNPETHRYNVIEEQDDIKSERTQSKQKELVEWHPAMSQSALKIVYSKVNRSYKLVVEDIGESTTKDGFTHVNDDNISTLRNDICEFELNFERKFMSASALDINLKEPQQTQDYVSDVIGFSFLWTYNSKLYAFVVHDVTSTAPKNDQSLSALEIVYVARLCALENTTTLMNRNNAKHETSEMQTLAFQSSTDEELAAVLMEPHFTRESLNRKS